MTDIIEHDTVEELAVVPGFTIAAHTLRDALTAGLLAAGKDDTLPTLASVRVEWDSESVRVVATDRYRLVVATIDRQDGMGHDARSNGYQNTADGAVLIDRKDAADLVKVLPKFARRGTVNLVAVSVVAGSVIVEGDGWSRSMMTVLGEFPKYRTLIPTEDMYGAVETVAYNPKFLADIGKLPAEKNTPVRLFFTKPERPMVAKLTPDNGVSEYLYMLMPVRITS
jgi:DNA polymerase-3 subunit beta